MEKEFIPYEQAVALKELGFDEGCFSLYFNNGEFSNFIHSFTVNSEVVEKTSSIPAPTFSQAFRWFREKYNFYNQIHKGYGWEGIIRNSSNGDILWNDGTYTSPEEAELECLKKLIEIVKEKQNAGTI